MQLETWIENILLSDPELLDLQLNDSNAVLRVLREMVDVRLLVNPRFLLIWNVFPLSISLLRCVLLKLEKVVVLTGFVIIHVFIGFHEQ